MCKSFVLKSLFSPLKAINSKRIWNILKIFQSGFHKITELKQPLTALQMIS